MTDIAGTQQPGMGNGNAPDGAGKTDVTKTAATADEMKSELELVRKALKDANREAESRRKKLDEYEAKEKQAEEAKLSEMEKLQNQLDAMKLEKENAVIAANQKLIRAEVLSKAAKFIDADAVYALLDKSKLAVKDDGSIDGVDALLDELAKAKPHLLKGQSSNLSATNPGNIATNETLEQKKARIFGTNASPFDMSTTIDKGGGVVINQGD